MKSIEVFFSLFVLSVSLSGQQTQITNFIVQNYKVTANDVIEIHAEQLPDETSFIIAWKANGQQHAYQFQINEQYFFLKLNVLPEWDGQIEWLGISLNRVVSEVRPMSLSDHWYYFLQSSPLTPGRVNFTPRYDLYGISYHGICMMLALFIAAIIFLRFRDFKEALFLGFLAGLILYDAREVKDRWDVLRGLARNDFHIPLYRELDTFLSESRKLIGEDCWTKEALSGVLNSYTTYFLADLCYIPGKAKSNKVADYIITTTPKKRKILYSHGPYYLTQKYPSR